jgi:general secretion pathway protein A
MLYESFYGLEREPFSLSPDPAFLYLTADGAEAFAQLIYAIESRKGFAVLTGEVGTGKTMLLRALLEAVGPEVRTAYQINPPRTRAELYAGLAAEFDLRLESPETWGLVLQRYLIDAHDHGVIVVALFDEAQALSPEVLDEIRLLTNLETASVKLLQVILAGQPELDVMLESHALRALRQRIVMRHQLQPLGSWETVEYIARRMRVAGADLLPFDGQACVAIYRYSRGIPRLINLLCDNSLVTGYAANQPLIDAAIVESAAHDAQLSALAGRDDERSRLERAAGGRRWRGFWRAAVTLAVVAAVSSAVLLKSYPERLRTLIYHVESLIGADSATDNQPLPPRFGRGGHSGIDRLTRAVLER